MKIVGVIEQRPIPPMRQNVIHDVRRHQHFAVYPVRVSAERVGAQEHQPDPPPAAIIATSRGTTLAPLALRLRVNRAAAALDQLSAAGMRTYSPNGVRHIRYREIVSSPRVSYTDPPSADIASMRPSAIMMHITASILFSSRCFRGKMLSLASR